MRLPSLFFVLCLSAVQCAYAQPNNPAPYCAAGFDDGADPANSIPAMPVPDAILQVQLGTLNNNSNAQAGNDHYTYNSSITAPTLLRGNTYTLSVKLDLQGGCGAAAWIDYNQNFVFDAGEKIWFNSSLPVGTIQTFTAAISIPTTAATGTTRFRVRLVEDDNYNMANNYVIIPCNLSTTPADVMDWGETEDYNVSIATTTGITEQQSYSVELFPNPAHESVTLRNTAGAGYVELLDVYGKTVLKQELQGVSDATIGLDALAEGVYLLRLVSAEGRITGTQKIIKK
ncbi:MAG: T9SS type A sorting domain-containing protein [Bacteroidetes bacterium]|nr:T9SS type A sorting domain-containing protein [Bacteroidota bacterium]